MPIDLNGSTLKVSAGYSLKVPAAADYSSEDAHVGISVEIEVGDGVETIEDLLAQAEDLEVDLHTTAKLAVFAQLGLEFEDEEGVLRPIIPPKAKAAPARKVAGKTSSGGSGGYGGGYSGGGRQSFKPAADRSELPLVTLGGVVYHDQRPLKEDGTYQERAADFRSVNKVDGRFSSLWITAKDGGYNEAVTAMLDEAGVEY